MNIKDSYLHGGTHVVKNINFLIAASGTNQNKLVATITWAEEGSSNTELAIPISGATFGSLTKNTVFAAPNGSNGVPSFRTLVAADIPNISANKITSDTLGADRLPLATNSAKGAVILGVAKTSDADSAITDKKYWVKMNANGKLFVDIPWTDHTYTVNNATFSIKSKIGTNDAVTLSDFTANQSAADDFTLILGSNITFTNDATNRTLTIAGTPNTIYKLTLNGTVKGTTGGTDLGTFYAIATSNASAANLVWMRNNDNTAYAWRALGNRAFDSTSYIPLAGSSTTSPITGTLYIKDADGIYINSNNLDKNIWHIVGSSGSWDSLFGFNLQYLGTGSSNNNDLILWAHALSGTHVEVYRVHQDGSFIFKSTPKVGTTSVSLVGHKHAYTDLTGSSTTADQAIVSNGTEDGWTLKTLGSRAFDSTAYVPIAGGTMTGVLHLKGSMNEDAANKGALNLANSDIYGVNSIKFSDLSNGASEGLQWYRDTTHIDSLWVKAGVIYFTPNRSFGNSATNYTVYHSGNIPSNSASAKGVVPAGVASSVYMTDASKNPSWTSIDITVTSGSSHLVTSGAVYTAIANNIASAVQYLGTITSEADMIALTSAGQGDFARVTTAFTFTDASGASVTAHVGDVVYLTNNTPGTSSNWLVAHTEIDTNTWTAASTSAAGYVPKLATGGANLAAASTDYVLAYVNGATTPSWLKLPANAYKNNNTTGIKLATVSGTKKTDSTLISIDSGTGLSIAGGTNKFSIGNGTNYIEVSVAHGLSTKNISINGTNYALYTSASSLPTIKAPTGFGNANLILATNADANGLTWVDKPTTNVTTSLYVGASDGASTAAQTAGNVYLILKEGSSYTRYNITGSGRASVTSDANGKITINSDPYSNFVVATENTAGTAGLVPAPSANLLGDYFLCANGAWVIPPNIWNAANTSLDGYIPKLVTGGAAISGQSTEYVLTYVSTETGIVVPKWKTLPANAFKDTWNAASFTLAGYVPQSVKGKYLHANAGDGSLEWIDDRDTTYSVFTGASATEDGTSGLVLAPTTGNLDKFLRANGTWDTPTNTWRNIYVGGALKMTTANRSKALNIAAGNNISLSYSKPGIGANQSGNNAYGTLTIAATNTWIAWKGATSQNNGTAGYMPAPTTALKDLFLRGDGSWVSLNNYSLPKATTSALGGIIVSNVLTTAITLTSSNGTTANRYYGVLLDKDGKAFVNIPWIWNAFTAATANAAGTAGYIQAPAGAQGKYFRGDNTWQTIEQNVTTSLYFGALNGTANAQVNTTPYLIFKEGSSYTRYKLEGAGGITVSSDASGNLKFTGTTYSVFTGASSSAAGSAGLVKQPAAGDQEKFLRGDCTWQSLTSNVTTSLYVGASNGTSTTAQSANGNVYLILKEGTFYTRYNIVGSGRASVTSDANGKITINSSGYSNFTAATSSAAGSAGLVPGPGKNILGSSGYYLRADGSWAVPTNTWNAANNSQAGYVPKLTTGGGTIATQSTEYVLTFVSGGTGTITPTWKLLPVNAFNNTWTAWKGATDSANGTAGYMPAPTSAQKGQFLRGDGSWVSLNNYSLPTASNSKLGGVKTGAAITDTTGYTAVAIKDGYIYYKDTDTWKALSSSQAGYAPKAANGVDSSSSNTYYFLGYLGTTVNWYKLPANAFNNNTYSDFKGSGTNHAHGLVPDPGATAGTTKYLREDGTWLTPPDNNTWDSCTTSRAGYVPKAVAGKFLHCDNSGNLEWIDDNNSHYTAIPILGGSSATSNATSDTANNATYLNIIENSAKSGGILITGSGGTSVKANRGVLTISSPSSDTTTTLTRASGNLTQDTWSTVGTFASTVADGTYVVLFTVDGTLYSGIFSRKSGDTLSEEINLHAAGTSARRLYARLSGSTFQIVTADATFSMAKTVFNFRKLI